MKKSYLFGMLLFSGFLLFATAASASGKEKEAPLADSGKMMLEHMDMDCAVCHGANGPRGVKMGNHPKQKCTDCHTQGTTKALTRKEKRTSIAREMMLKHGAALQCKLCHGEQGPNGMMMEHIGMDCQTCHVVEDK